jgi:hypothetical protein
MDRGELFSVKADISKMIRCNEIYIKELGMGEREVLLSNGRLLAKDISDAEPPKNLSRAKDRANKQIARAFYKQPPNRFPNDSKQQGSGDVAWLYAGGKGITNYVVGIDRDKLKEKTSLKEVLDVLKSKQRGAKWESRTNERGTHVKIVKKPMITRTMFNTAAKHVQNRFGRLKASFAKAAAECGCGFDVPDFVQKHVRNAKGRGAVQLGESNAVKSLIFISSADGVQSEASWKAIRGGIHGRANKMAKDLKNILSGAYKRAGFALAK